MILKKKRLADCRLYLILDTQVLADAELWRVMKEAVRGGVDIVQLRDKLGNAQRTLSLAMKLRKYLDGKALFIVNDRVDIAYLSGADGVHLGQDDLPVAGARKLLGAGAVIGRSCQTVTHIHRAADEGADYIGFGSVFKTLTKPERSPMASGFLKKAGQAAEKKNLPLFAIGGIERSNVVRVRAEGVSRIAVCRDILLDGNPVGAARELVRMLKGAN